MKKCCGFASNMGSRVIDKISYRGREVLRKPGKPGFSLFILILLVFIGWVPIVHGAEVPVDSIAALNAAISAANPGDTIILANGTYPSAGTIDFNANGALGSEITVKAETPGKVVITGNPSHIYMSGSYLILSGFHFRDIDTSGNWNTLLIRLDNLIYSRITNCKIENVGQGGGSTIVGIWDNSDHNRIDHCTWDGVDGVGVETVLRYYGDTINSTHTQIDHNKFMNHAQDDASEALRLGRGATSALVNANMTIEYNYFQNWHGDPEVISVKSSNNVLRYNVIKNCNGAYKLRVGNHNTLEGNFYVLEDSESWDDYPSAIGIKIKGKDHKVINNYIYRGWHGVSLENAPLLTYEGSATSQPSEAEPYYLTDTNATYSDDQYNGQYVWITSGGGAGKAYYVHDTDRSSQRLHLYTQNGGNNANLRVDGVTTGSAYFINTGDPEVRNLLLANNTIVNNRRNGIMVKSTSSNCTFMNNLALTNRNSDLFYLFQEDSGANVDYITNLGYSTGTMDVWSGDNGQPAGISTADPGMDCSGEICRLQDLSFSFNAIGQATPIPTVIDDIDGHTRDAGSPDIGCDEYSTADMIRSIAMIEEAAGVQWLAAPMGLHVVTSAAEVTLAWEANTEPALAGYKIYYDIDSGGHYSGTGAEEGDSPIMITLADLSDPDNPEYTIHFSNGDTHFFAITAIDTNDNETAYSNEVFYPLPGVGIDVLETGRYVTTGKGKNKTTTFETTDSFNAGDEVVILASVRDASTEDLPVPVTDATVQIGISGPEVTTLVSDLSDSGGIAEATWKTSASRNKKQPGTAPGDYTATVTEVTADGYIWDGMSTSIDFTIQ